MQFLQIRLAAKPLQSNSSSSYSVWLVVLCDVMWCCYAAVYLKTPCGLSAVTGESSAWIYVRGLPFKFICDQHMVRVNIWGHPTPPAVPCVLSCQTQTYSAHVLKNTNTCVTGENSHCSVLQSRGIHVSGPWDTEAWAPIRNVNSPSLRFLQTLRNNCGRFDHDKIIKSLSRHTFPSMGVNKRSPQSVT